MIKLRSGPPPPPYFPPPLPPDTPPPPGRHVALRPAAVLWMKPPKGCHRDFLISPQDKRRGGRGVFSGFDSPTWRGTNEPSGIPLVRTPQRPSNKSAPPPLPPTPPPPPPPYSQGGAWDMCPQNSSSCSLYNNITSY